MNEHTGEMQPPLVRVVADLLEQLHGTVVTECEVRAGDVHVALRRLVVGAGTIPIPVAPEESGVPASWAPIVSPLTGIFYLTESPQSPPLASVGMTVAEHQVVGLIESMKMYNPVETDLAGTVRAILVQHGAIVEKGQSLMYVEPAGDQR